MKRRIHILGASGSGTSSIAGKVCEKLGYKHFDTDSYFWMPTENPFTEIRPHEERLELMQQDLSSVRDWILSGSLIRWGDPLIELFDLVVFVYVPPEIRMERLQKREFERYGERVLPGGDRYENSREFLEWARGYDGDPRVGRSLVKHRAWLEKLSQPVLDIVNISLDESVESLVEYIKA